MSFFATWVHGRHLGLPRLLRGSACPRTQTPRVWLFGYDHNHNPLKGAEWRSDFSPEHVDKTVTHESHPHHSYSCPSIHPCK